MGHKRIIQLGELFIPKPIQSILDRLRATDRVHYIAQRFADALDYSRSPLVHVFCSATPAGPVPLNNFTGIAVLQTLQIEGRLKDPKISVTWVDINDTSSLLSVLCNLADHPFMTLSAFAHLRCAGRLTAYDICRATTQSLAGTYKTIEVVKEIGKGGPEAQRVLSLLFAGRGVCAVADELRKERRREKGERPSKSTRKRITTQKRNLNERRDSQRESQQLPLFPTS